MALSTSNVFHMHRIRFWVRVRLLNFSALKSFDHLTAVSGVGSSPALATCEKSQVLLAGVSGGFPAVLLFCLTYRSSRLGMSEIILKGTLN